MEFDIAICGAGPVGMALAAFLARRGMPGASIAVLDGRALEQAVADPRSIAVSYGSRQLLEGIGAWTFPATAIHDIHVSRRGRLGRSLIDRHDHEVPALGYVARYGDMVAALSKACEREGIQVLRPRRVSGYAEVDTHVDLHLHDGASLRCRIAVQAEGGVFGEQKQRALARDYQQTAVIARVAASHPHPHRAFERFTDEGPLALLPQDGTDGLQYALVWCARPDSTAHLLGLTDDAFLARLNEAFGTRLGSFTAVGTRHAYKLGLNADAATTARTAAIGNAAQTLHPVAGQGLNLGLRDAAVLASLLAREATPAQLARFDSERRADRKAIVEVTDAMARVFASSGPGQALLGLSLAAIDVVAPARGLLAELMMFGRR
jgi:2-octaprenyl-6-methoxyphenol hydroxylase